MSKDEIFMTILAVALLVFALLVGLTHKNLGEKCNDMGGLYLKQNNGRVCLVGGEVIDINY